MQWSWERDVICFLLWSWMEKGFRVVISAETLGFLRMVYCYM
jgi:hypothetical protein